MIKDNILKIKQTISEICQAVKRKPGTIKLLAATKSRTIDQINESINLGIDIVGENKVQELNNKLPFLPSNIRVDFIGHLQSNKVLDVVKSCFLIHSVDSLRLAKKISYEAQKLNKNQLILLEINVSGEPTKSGFRSDEILNIFSKINSLSNIKISGLMTMAPYFDNPEQTRSIFNKLKQVKEKLEKTFKMNLPELSMGMSNDYKIAIEEGATIIRLGRNIFE